MPLWLIRVDSPSRGSTAGSSMLSEHEVNEMNPNLASAVHRLVCNVNRT